MDRSFDMAARAWTFAGVERERRSSVRMTVPLTLQCSVGQADLAVGGDVRPFVLPLLTRIPSRTATTG
jgi:hypothetical protein